MSLILDIYQSRKTLANLQQVVQQLKQDVMQQMDVPPGQKAQVKNQLGDTVKQTVVKKVNGKMKSGYPTWTNDICIPFQFSLKQPEDP